MTKISKWKITQWILFIVFIAYYILITLSPWYYSLTYSRQVKEEENQRYLEEQGEREKVEPYYTDQYGYTYNARGERINEYGDVLNEQGQWMPDPLIEGEELYETEEDLDNTPGEIEYYEDESMMTFKEKMILKMEEDNKSEDTLDSEEDELQKKYKNQGKLSSLDHLYVLTLLLSLSYGYGVFLSSKSTAIILNLIPLTLLIIKTLFIYKMIKIYRINLGNMISWWLGFMVYLIFFYINDRTIVFIDID